MDADIGGEIFDFDIPDEALEPAANDKPNTSAGRDKARRIAANIAKLPEPLRKP